MSSNQLVTHIKFLYHAYRHTSDLNSKGLYFSKTCLQICRPTPSYSATTRDEIIQYLKDAQQGKVPTKSTSFDAAANAEASKDVQHASTSDTNGRGVYTIRALKTSELEFGQNENTVPVGLTVGELKAKAEKEQWIGMRVDLWDEGGQENGLLVKVQYWWRRENVPEEERFKGEENGFGWRQCLHDIMYLGPKDGSEGGEGLEVLE